MTAVFVFGFDIAEASQIRRIRLFQDAGLTVASAAMRRNNMNSGFQPEWPNIELSEIPNGKLASRVFSILGSAMKMFKHRKQVAESDIIWARNFDMLVIAWLTRLMSGSRGRHRPLVYECLDIHGLFTRKDIIGAVLRSAERFLLRRINLLVVSSPGFIEHYFEPAQRYDGPWELIENKISFTASSPARPEPRIAPPEPRAPRIGWVGTLRCLPSFELLLGLAERLGDKVRIEMHGIVHDHVLTDFHERIQKHPNITFHGPYTYPDGLIDIYKSCDFVWSQDLWQRGANSDWLLPNRIYEASWCGCPSIAVAKTVTGMYVEKHQLGFVVGQPNIDDLADCIDRAWPNAAVDCANGLLARDPFAFQQSKQDVRSALAPVLSTEPHQTEAAPS
ncbi:MAG: glycosyltransferase [Paracoccaceae bacterium]